MDAFGQHRCSEVCLCVVLVSAFRNDAVGGFFPRGAVLFVTEIPPLPLGYLQGDLIPQTVRLQRNDRIPRVYVIRVLKNQLRPAPFTCNCFSVSPNVSLNLLSYFHLVLLAPALLTPWVRCVRASQPLRTCADIVFCPNTPLPNAMLHQDVHAVVGGVLEARRPA